MNTESATSSNLSQHVDDLRRNAGAVTEDLKKEAQTRFQDVKEQAGDQLQDAKATAKDLAASLRSYVAEHPLAAFGAGILLGLFLSSRVRR